MSEEMPAAVEQPEASNESTPAEPPAPVAAASPETPADPFGTVVELPAGLWHKGQVHRDVEIVPMTGLTRKAIARKEVRANPSKVTDIILGQCINRIGTFTHISDKVLDNLVLGDKDFLLLEIRRVSMGDTFKSNVTCAACSNDIEVTFHIDELEVIRIKEGEYEVVDEQRTFRIQDEALKIDAVLRYPVGKDQGALLGVSDRNPVEANFKLYAECLLQWAGDKGPFRASFFERMPVRVLDEFEDQFTKAQPGPVFEQSVGCPACAANIEFTFEGSDFLFRPTRRGKTS
jgi:hypothetical protein